MMFNFLLAPGQLVARLFTEKKKRYRSVRYRQPGGPVVAVASLIFWAALLGCGFWLGALHSQSERAALETTGAQPAASAVPAPPAAEQPGGTPVAADQATGGQAVPAAPAAGDPRPAPPAGQTENWLVILHTIPKTARDEAERRQAQYQTRGLEVQILDTDAYPRLLGGYWIIALGPFDSRDAAAEMANTAKPFITSGLMIKRGL